MSDDPADVVLLAHFPCVDDYCRLRRESGLSPRTTTAAARGLANTLYGVSLMHAGAVVGMGRIIGDGGCFYTIVDIAVAPRWQKRGLGKRILDALDQWLRANAEPSAYVNLVADGDARHLYRKYGFVDSAPHSINMAYSVPVPSPP